MAKDIALKLTPAQARELYRLIYDHGHWRNDLFFPLKEALLDALGIDEQTLEEDREEKDKGVNKLFALYRQAGPPALAEALGLGRPEAINMEALTWQDLEAIWYQISVSHRSSKQPDPAVTGQPEQDTMSKPFLIASVCRADLRDILTAAQIAGLSDGDMEDIAGRMSDAHRDSGGYWESLEIMARFVIQRKEESIE